MLDANIYLYIHSPSSRSAAVRVLGADEHRQTTIPFAFEAAALLAASPRPNHVVGLHSSGLTPWPPSGNFKDKGYIAESV